MSLVDLGRAQVNEKPFPHFLVENAISDDLTERLLCWFESDAPWKLKIASFYEQYEFSFFDGSIPAQFGDLCSSDTLSRLRTDLSGLFGTRLCELVDVTAHQLVPGQRIRIHNDFIPGRETHRLLIQLNREWSDDCGGLLMLFETPEPSGVRRLIQPISRSAQGFAISKDSHHAVSTVHQGKRFTLVYSFYESVPPRDPDCSLVRKGIGNEAERSE